MLTKNTSQVNILSLPLPTSIGKDRQDHRRLKANGAKMLENMKSKNISYEIANLDVYSYDLGIATECGKSDGNKLLDFYNNSYQGIENYQEFWVLEYYDENHISRLHKYKLTQAPEAER